MPGTNPPFMSGIPEMLLLKLLKRQEMYGYELVRAIRTVTGESISLGEGVVYPVLHSLEKSGALKARRKKVAGRARVYYSLTSKGDKRLRALQQEWERICSGVAAAFEEPARA